jgi:hypothetical protein
MYKRSGQYYILLTNPPSSEYTLKASSPFGSYSIKVLSYVVSPPSTTGGGNPHQGGLVDTPSGQWYYMSFIDAYPWGSDGFPTLQVSISLIIV